MACKSKSDSHCLCEVNYPYRRIAASSEVKATKPGDCTIRERGSSGADNQTLAFESNMDMVSLAEFITGAPHAAVFGTYLARPKSGHFCVDKGRRTVDGRRLSWLWIFPTGRVGPSNKRMSAGPELVWTKRAIIDAYEAAHNETLPMFTRHVEIYSELAITFCLPLPG
jgi:hypothetical protein